MLSRIPNVNAYGCGLKPMSYAQTANQKFNQDVQTQDADGMQAMSV